MNFSKNQVWSFGKTKKSSLYSSSETPGPGRYASTTTFGTKLNGGKFGKDTRLKYKNNHNPGVGMYTTNKNSLAPKYSFPLSSNKQNNTINNSTIQTPGPGRYNINENQNKLTNKMKSPSYSIAGKPLKKETNFNPGPGQYSTDLHTIDRNINPKHKIAQSKREINMSNSNYTPGPGRYNADDNKKRVMSPVYSFSGSTKENLMIKNALRNNHPGPGSYGDIDNQIGKNAPKYSISKQERHNNMNNSMNNFNVGPGRYNVTITDLKQNNKGFKYGNSKRSFDYTNSNPGPGQYDPKTARADQPKYSISKSDRNQNNFNSKDNLQLPGPGRYNTNDGFDGLDKNKNRGFTFSGKGPKAKMNENPGPGNYENDTNMIKGKNPSWKIPESKRYDEVLKAEESKCTPGPGRYNSNLNKSNSNIVFSKDIRLKDNKNLNPGPGQYKIPCSIRDVNEFSTTGGNFDPYYKFV